MTIKRKAARLAVAGAMGVGVLVSIAPPAQSATVLATLFEHSRHRGNTHNLPHPSNAYLCTSTMSDLDGRYGSLPNFNDKTSSLKGFGCQVKLFEHPNEVGPGQTEWSHWLTYVGDAMNDRASSARVT